MRDRRNPRNVTPNIESRAVLASGTVKVKVVPACKVTTGASLPPNLVVENRSPFTMTGSRNAVKVFEVIESRLSVEKKPVFEVEENNCTMESLLKIALMTMDPPSSVLTEPALIETSWLTSATAAKSTSRVPIEEEAPVPTTSALSDLTTVADWAWGREPAMTKPAEAMDRQVREGFISLDVRRGGQQNITEPYRLPANDI